MNDADSITTPSITSPLTDPLVIAPLDWRRLLSSDERARMLDDIACVSLSVGTRLFPGQDWQDFDVASHSIAIRKSPIERLAFIEQLIPSMAQAIRQIEGSPLTQTASDMRRVMPPIRAKHVSTQAIMAAVRRGPSFRALDETTTVLSYNTPENRAVGAFCSVLERDCRAIEAIARAEDEAEAAERAAQCLLHLCSIRTAAWWESVAADRAAWLSPPTQRASLRPEYAAVFQAMSRCRAGFRFDWNQPLLTLPPRETWRLYEAWCLVQTLEALRALGCEVTGGSLLTAREGRLAFMPAAGEPSRVTLRLPAGRTLSLVSNQTFAEGKHSLSHTMQPDIILTDGEQLWILDAKFKAYSAPGEEGEDINQMHAYRDALVDAHGVRNAACAWCLYAGLPNIRNRSHITYGRSANTAVGALCLRPGDRSAVINLRALLASWLGTEPPASPQN